MTVTLTGSNHFLLHKELHELTDSFVREQGDLALERLDGEEASYERISEAIQSLPFLSAKKMVLIKMPGAQKQFAERIDDILGIVSDSTDLVIIEPKLDKRLSYYKTLKSKTDFREFGEPDVRALSSWLVEQAKSQGATLDMQSAAYLVERAGANQELLSHELDKLISYTPNVTKQTIDLLTEPAPQSTIFELLDAAFAGDTKRALHLYDEQRALKVEPQQIIAMLAWQLQVLAVLKTAGERSVETIAKEAKLNPFVLRKSAQIARKLSLTEVKQLINDALKLDIRLKSQSIDADEALKYFLLTISSEL